MSKRLLNSDALLEQRLLRGWIRGITVLQVAHGLASERFDKRSRLLVVTSAGIATVVGTATFATLALSTSTVMRFSTAVFALIAAVLGVAPMAFNYPDLASSHRGAAIRFGQLRRATELVLLEALSDAVDVEKMSQIKDAWRDIEEGVPPVPDKIRQRAGDLPRSLDWDLLAAATPAPAPRSFGSGTKERAVSPLRS